jgi:hypothetical protein
MNHIREKEYKELLAGYSQLTHALKHGPEIDMLLGAPHVTLEPVVSISGGTTLGFYMRDSDVMDRMPEDVRDEMLLKHGNHPCSFCLRSTETSVCAWIRLEETDQKIGILTLISISFDPGEMRFAPNGAAAQLYRRGMAMIAAYGRTLNQDEFDAWSKANMEPF